jgi:hypothetical protein
MLALSISGHDPEQTSSIVTGRAKYCGAADYSGKMACYPSARGEELARCRGSTPLGCGLGLLLTYGPPLVLCDLNSSSRAIHVLRREGTLERSPPYTGTFVLR